MLSISMCSSGLVGRGGYSSARGNRSEFSTRKTGETLFGTKNVQDIGRRKNPEMFRLIAIENRLTTPYGRKVLGNLRGMCLRDVIKSGLKIVVEMLKEKMTGN